MRDVLVHEYWGIDVNVLWATVHEGLPPLKAVIVEITRNLQNT
ncbi:HepT-like ribonuclease domain-containing protein [Scytonema sp. PRP1]